MCVPVGRKGAGWQQVLTPLPALRSPTLSETASGTLCSSSGSIWGKMTYTEKYVTSLFKNFKLYLKRLLSCPVMYTMTPQLQCHIRASRAHCPRPRPERFRLTEMAPVPSHWGRMRQGLLRGPALGGSCIPPELAASQKLQDPCPWPASSHVLFPYFKSWNSRGEREHFPLHR